MHKALTEAARAVVSAINLLRPDIGSKELSRWFTSQKDSIFRHARDLDQAVEETEKELGQTRLRLLQLLQIFACQEASYESPGEIYLLNRRRISNAMQ